MGEIATGFPGYDSVILKANGTGPSRRSATAPACTSNIINEQSPGTAIFGVAVVTSALNTVNALNTTLGALPGMNVTINGNTTIAATSSRFSASGSGLAAARSAPRAVSAADNR
jgi:hypothetical protein